MNNSMLEVSCSQIKSDIYGKEFTIIRNQNPNNGKNLILVQDYFPENNGFGERSTPWGAKLKMHGMPEAAFGIMQDLIKQYNFNSLTIYPLAPYSMLKAESGEREETYKNSFKVLDKLIEKQQTRQSVDGIIFGGYYGLDENFFNKFDANKFGRIFDYNGIPCIYTLSPNMIGMDKKGAIQENCASLIGFFYHHVEELLEGKNRYTIDKNNWTGILVKTIEKFDEMLEEIKNSPVTSWDCETTGLSRTQETLLTIQIATSSKKAWVLPWQHKQSPWTAKEIDYMRDKLKEYFEFGKSKFHIYQNAKYDISQFITHFNLKYYAHPIFDLMSGNFALDEARKFLTEIGITGPYTLEFVAKNYGAGDIFKEGKLGKEDRVTLEDADLEDIAEYGIKDVILPYQICKFQLMEAKRRGDSGFYKLITQQISDMIYCFTIMEHNGVKVDKKYLLNLRDRNSELAKNLEKVENELKALESVQKTNDILLEINHIPAQAGLFGKRWLFDISKEQSQQILFFDVLGLKPLTSKKNGDGALGKEFKEHYKKTVPEVALLDKFDKIRKIKSTFIDAHFDRYLTDKDLQADSRMRASYQFTGVVTGRASACVTMDCLTNVNGKLYNGHQALSAFNPKKIEILEKNLLVDTSVGAKNTSHIMYHKRKEVFRIGTEEGFSVGLTSVTPILTLNKNFRLEWKEAKNLKEGDFILVKPYTNTKMQPLIPQGKRTPKKMTKSLAKLLGYICGTGTDKALFYSDSKEITNKYKKFWDTAFRTLGTSDFHNTETNAFYHLNNNDILKVFFGRIGLYDAQGNINIPWVIKQSPLNYIVEFLDSFFEIDKGFQVSPEKIVTGYMETEKAKQLQILLLKLGIFSIRKEFVKTCRLEITESESKNLFGKYFKDFVSIEFPEVEDKIKSVLETLESLGNKEYSVERYNEEGVDGLRKNHKFYQVVYYLSKEDIRIVKINSLQKKREDVYDFCIEAPKEYNGLISQQHYVRDVLEGNYLANGIIVHNSNPNLQQIPSRGEYAKLVKRQFIANPNHLILKADYSAHEVRNWGNISGDELVGAAFDFGKHLRKQIRYYFADDLQEWEKFRKFQKDTRWVVPKDSDKKALTYDEKLELIKTVMEKKFHKICQLCFDLENKGDVHKLNYEFFFGTPAYLVNKQQRQSVKAIVFGTLYGKGIPTLAEDIGGTNEQAQEIVDKLFEKFEKGGKWIKHCQEVGKTSCEVHSPLGRIRHLWAYKHSGYSVQASMDRKGPNSCIQGFSSDIGFMAGKIMQDLCWNWFWKRGINFDFKYMNVVHDSTETECAVRHLPIVSYMLEHSYSTLTHRRLRDVFNFELICGYETEQELGASMCHTEVYENSCELMRLIREGIEWGKENIEGYYVDPEEIEIAQHNHEIMQKYRKQELKDTYGKKIDYEMLLNEDNILNIGLIL